MEISPRKNTAKAKKKQHGKTKAAQTAVSSASFLMTVISKWFLHWESASELDKSKGKNIRKIVLEIKRVTGTQSNEFDLCEAKGVRVGKIDWVRNVEQLKLEI